MHHFRQHFLSALLLLLATAPSGRARAQDKPNDAFINAISAKFSSWDKNHDETLSVEELDAAIVDPANQGPAAAALAALKRASRSKNYHLPPLTLAGIRELATNPPATNQPNLRALYRQSLNRISRVTHHELFASGLPQLSTIHQGTMGNCFCLAPLGALLHRDSHEVASMFSTQPDGQILVRFGGGAVSVAPPTDAELAITSGNTQDGVWVNLFEKAIAQARNNQKLPDKQSDLPIDAIAYGGSEGVILSYLTGHKVSGLSLDFGNDPVTLDAVRTATLAELRQKLAAATGQKRLMACGTRKTTTPGLTPNHAYALLEYHPQTDTVDLWNPHGDNFNPKGPPGLTNGYPTTNGLFTVPVTEFVQQFNHVSFEGTEPASHQWLDQWRVVAQSGHLEEAAADLSEIIESDPSEYWNWYMLTPLLIESGKTAAYRANCQAMLNRFSGTSVPKIAEATAKSCLLLPAAVGPDDLTLACQVADRAVALSKKGDWMHWRLMTRGLAEYRQGQFTNAIETMLLSQKALTDEHDVAGPMCEADTWFVSAMAHLQLKQRREARAALSHGLEIVQKKLPKLDSEDLGPAWHDVLMTHTLMREAKETIEGKPVANRK